MASHKTDVADLARASASGILTVQEAAESLGLTPRRAAAKLARLHEQGWVVRLRRGLYYVLPLEAATAHQTTVLDPWPLAMALYSPAYIGGWSAAEYWGLTEQLFRSTFVVTGANIRNRNETFLGATFQLVRVDLARLGGVEAVWRGSAKVQLSGRERTIADALRNPSWVGGLRHLIEILTRYSSEDPSRLNRLGEEVLRQGSGAAAKRAGYIMEVLLGRLPNELAILRSHLSSGVIKLDPDLSRKGRLDKRWGLWVNSEVA